MPFKILFLGQPENQHWLQEAVAGCGDMKLVVVCSENEAIALARDEAPQAVVVDFDLPKFQPLNFLRRAQDEQIVAEFFGITSVGSLRLAVSAVKAGFVDVVDLNEEPAKLQKELSKLAQHWEERQKGEAMHQEQRVQFDRGQIIGESAAMQQVFAMLAKISERKWVTVLLRGETGTGKELIARTLHYNSFSHFQPFVEINCSAIPENLLESEIFGYEKGAFTDAKTRKKGLFELAENGTLFLDEIGDVSPLVQVKLLKAIEEKKIRRLGGTEDLQINARIIAATNRDLQAAIRDGQFRQDLYYRLNVITIQLPPLRERGDDALLLARHFLSHYAKTYESHLAHFTPEADALLKNYHWPGNVRELQHTLERIALLAEGPLVTREALAAAIESEMPLIMSEKNQATTVKIAIPAEGISLAEGEKKLIQAVLEEMNWNKRKTCRALKISRPRLDRKIEKYELRPPSKAKW